ncbi:hypothetical protein ACMSZN_000724 [Cronobacter dublinensis]
MSEISKERVEALASNILECHDVKPSEVKALAGLALLALRERAEPVADDDRARQEYENHVRSRYQYPMLERHTEDGSPWNGEYKEPARQMEWEDWQCSWNACRAAMLAAPGTN